MTQNEALTILKTGANVFLTGEPGSGKTHTVNQYVAYLHSCNIEPAITASTGIAATHIGGMTIHSWSGIGIKNKLNKYDLDRITSSEWVVKRVKRAKVLIIDEISMLSSETLSMVDLVCREIKQNEDSFGGIQVVLVGDFFQLPPIVKMDAEQESQISFLDEPVSLFAYDSPAWKKSQPIVCYLTEQHRQDDKEFLSLLSAIRRNTFSDNHLKHIESRKTDYKKVPDDVPKLFSHNVDVNYVNDEMLEKISGNPRSFAMTSQGKDVLVSILQKGCLSPETLCLKPGASVMFTKNNPKKGFVNGTLGTVKGFNGLSKQPIVVIRSGKMIEVEPMEWAIEENGKIKARISQLPLRLAWAITVHKSQGMSLDEAVIDLNDVFEFGQGYVALSRVRRLSGLHLLGWNKRAFQVHPEVLKKDEMFRDGSERASEAFAKLEKTEIEKMHKDFITACGGMNVSEKSSSGKLQKKEKKGSLVSFEKIREKYPNAYRPWDDSQDNKLKKLFEKGETIKDLAKVFERKTGAIRSRLVKLWIIEE